MLSFIAKFFGKALPKSTLPRPGDGAAADFSAHLPTVEVVHLSLEAILGRLPEDLKPLVTNPPAEGATVALPLPTIIKQLPVGVVKISLASLHRQAPPGVLGPLPPGDKRMVEVPLAEVFRHVSPTLLRRRSDQREFEAPTEDFSLFGNTPNPYELSPRAVAPKAPAKSEMPKVEAVTAARSGGPALILPLHEDAAVAGGATYSPELKIPVPPVNESPSDPAPRKSLAPTAEFSAVMKAPLAGSRGGTPSGDEGPSLQLKIEPLAAAWPEPIKQELSKLNGTGLVNLPTNEVTAGLAKGKVAFSWGQIRSWLAPALGEASAADDSTMLLLPLKLVAPAFLAATKRPRATVAPAPVDESIPALFNSTAGPTAPALELAPAATPVVAAPPPADPHPPEAAAPPAEEVPAAVADAGRAEPQNQEPTADPSVPAHPEAAVEPAAGEVAAVEMAIGEILGQPEKLHWTPGEMVAALAKMPGVAGAVVALQEGLLVAEALSPGMQGEVFAAFLPQIFARLNQYTTEMQFGEVDDLLFTTKGAHCQIYRLGFIYFAILGKPGEALPWTQLGAIAGELSKQTQKPERDY